MPTYGSIKVNTLTFDVSGSATDLPISTIATDSDVALKADINSPTFTGSPTVPGYAALSGATFTGQINATDIVCSNNLTVNGTQTILNTETLQVEDKEIDLGKVSSPSNASASGGGIKLLGGSDGDKTITWLSSNNAWNFSEDIELASGKTFIGDGSTITALNASNISSGTIADARFPATLPAISGANLTNLPPGGNTFTAVANGNIANNKAVKIDTDGKVSEVKTALSARTTVQSTGAAIPLTITEKNEYIKVVNCGEDKVLAIFQKTSGTWQVNAQVGYHQSGHNYATWGSDTHIIANAGSIRIGVPDAVYIGNNKVIVAFQYDDDINLYMGTVNTSNNTVSFGATLTLAAFANHSPSLSYDPDNDNVLCCYSGTSNRGAAQVITWSGTTLSAGTTVYFPQISSNVGIGAKTATYDTNDNKHIVAFRYDDYNNRGYIVSVSVSGTTPTFGSLVQFCGTDTSTDNLSNNLLGIAFDDNVNKFALFYTAGSRCWRHVGSCSSGTISITPSDQASSIYTHGNGDIFPTIIFEPVSKAFVAMAVSSSGGTFNRYAQYAFFSSNANGTYANSSSALFMGDATKYTSVAHYGKTTEGLVTLVYQNYSASSGEEVAKSQDGTTTTIASTLTDPHHYVGFADQAYTNGQTATIKTYGNHVDTLSGLTPGTKYYLQEDGTVGTSNGFAAFDARAGYAIGSTKLLIRPQA